MPVKPRPFRCKGQIKESLHTFVNEETKRKLEEGARKEFCSVGEFIDETIRLHLRKDGVRM